MGPIRLRPTATALGRVAAFVLWGENQAVQLVDELETVLVSVPDLCQRSLKTGSDPIYG